MESELITLLSGMLAAQLERIPMELLKSDPSIIEFMNEEGFGEGLEIVLEQTKIHRPDLVELIEKMEYILERVKEPYFQV